MDLGNQCSVGGEEGVCHSSAKCSGLGLKQAGACTLGRSVCCTEVSSCASSFKSSVSYFTQPQHVDGERSCQAKVEIQSNVCYLRLNLEEFDLPLGSSGKCGKVSFSISIEKFGNLSSINLGCGHKTGLEVLLPVTSGSVVFMNVLLGTSLARWKVKISQEKCTMTRTRHPDLADNCSSNMKKSRGREKMVMKRMKKQLFDIKKKRRKSRRIKRGIFPSLFNIDWVFGLSEGKGRKKEEEYTRAPAHQYKVNTLLEIASQRVKEVPSDFFEVVTLSNMELSKFSGHQPLKSEPSNKTLAKKVNKKSEDTRRRRNFKRRKSLFPSSDSVSWSGRLVEDTTRRTCGPAYLVTPSHALTGGGSGCLLGSRTGTTTLTVIFSVYRVPVTRVTLHSDRMALLTLHSPVPSNVAPLCGARVGNSVRDWVEEAMGEVEV